MFLRLRPLTAISRPCRCVYSSIGGQATQLKSIHSLRKVGKDAKPRVSPSVSRRNKDQEQIQTATSMSSTSLEDSLPPRNLLDMGHKSGALPLKPEEAIQVLTEYYEALRNRSTDWESRFCAENKIKPEILTLLGGILNKCANTPQKILGKHLMLTASALGDEPATLQLLRSAYRTGRLQSADYRAPLLQLKTLSKNGSVPSMVLLGRIREGQGKDKEALDLYVRAALSIPESIEEVTIEDVDALVYQGSLLSKMNKQVEAKVALEKAALKYDHPLAYYQLAQLQTYDSSTREVYLIKAASSGVVDACHDLGMFYLDRASSEESGKDSTMGCEWLYVAAESGKGESMLRLATRQYSDGERTAALAWLNKALQNEDADVVGRAEALRMQWSSTG